MANWNFYNEQGEKISVTGKELKELALTGKVTPDTSVEAPSGRTGLAKDVKGLTFAEAVQPEIYDVRSPEPKPLPSIPVPPIEVNPFTSPAPIEINPFTVRVPVEEVNPFTLVKPVSTNLYSPINETTVGEYQREQELERLEIEARQREREADAMRRKAEADAIRRREMEELTRRREMETNARNQQNTEPTHPHKGSFCMNCGQSISHWSSVCKFCGASIIGHRNFCRYCGSSLNPEQVVCLRCKKTVNTGQTSGVESFLHFLVMFGLGVALLSNGSEWGLIAIIFAFAMFLLNCVQMLTGK